MMNLHVARALLIGLVLCTWATTSAAKCPTSFFEPHSVKIAGGLGNIVIDDDCRYIYAINRGNARIEVFSLETSALQSPIPLSTNAYGLDISADGESLYVGVGRSLVEINIASKAPTRIVEIPAAAEYIAALQNGDIFLMTANAVYQFDLSTNVATHRIGESFIRMVRDTDRTTLLIKTAGPGMLKYSASADAFSRYGRIEGTLALSGDGLTALTGSEPQVRDPLSRIIGSFTGGDRTSSGFAVNKDGTIAYQILNSGIDVLDIRRYRRDSHIALADVMANTRNIRHISLSSDDTILAVVTDDGLSILQAPKLREPPSISVIALSSRSGRNQSLFRFSNAGSSAGAVHITLTDIETGKALGVWESPQIPPGSAPQYSMGMIEEVVEISIRPQLYLAKIRATIVGSFAHVVWRPQGSLTNISTCLPGSSVDTKRLIDVHSSELDSQYPSYIVVANTGSVPSAMELGIYDARAGQKLGRFVSELIEPSKGKVYFIGEIEEGAKIVPAASIPHYVLVLENEFPGTMQHLVNNLHTGIVADMTAACSLPKL